MKSVPGRGVDLIFIMMAGPAVIDNSVSNVIHVGAKPLSDKLSCKDLAPASPDKRTCIGVSATFESLLTGHHSAVLHDTMLTASE